ncbi:MAG: asparagine synthase C-terminal domain-containing protein [Candidatus Omnitrophica bacterium]|nr:asparagine synthase C-terminal domain-containing protein [Candidatus Omnitrophota bacterium]MCM8802343.1 asparagine synthase C-terminal domain-containing protein [Candidatus Omnitrophota bacterium]
MEKLILNLRERLKILSEKNKGDFLLFSGGLDTSILAYLNPNLVCVNVSLKEYGEDRNYAEILERFLNLKVYYLKFDEKETIGAIPKVIRILKTFDPAILNDVVVYLGLKFIKEKKGKLVLTGDGADEIFAGYSYMKEIDDLNSYIRKITKKMEFTSNKIGKFFNLEIRQPFCDKELIEFSLSIDKELKIKDGFGKWILRKSFENILPDEIVW